LTRLGLVTAFAAALPALTVAKAFQFHINLQKMPL